MPTLISRQNWIEKWVESYLLICKDAYKFKAFESVFTVIYEVLS